MRIVVLLLASLWASTLLAVEPMERGVDTEKVWAGQADQIAEVSDAAPLFTGMFVWSGRADRNYKPFFQWEMRIRGGQEDVRGLRVRVQPLGPDLQPLQAAHTGHWQRVGDLASGEEADWSYMINTPIFPAYRVYFQWQGGEASYLASDRQSLPVREGGPEDGLPRLVVLDPIWERNGRGQAMVGFWLRNQGSGSAEGVNLTLRLRDGEGKVLLEHPFIPEEGTIPVGYAQEQRVLIERTPPFHNVQISVSMAESSTMSLDPGALGSGDSVEVGELRKDGEVLHGKLRNGSSDTLRSVQITVSFVDDSGAAVGEATAQVARAAPGEVVDWSLPLTGIAAWSGYETSLSFDVDEIVSEGAEGAEGAGDSAVAAAPVITVDGLSLTILDAQGADGVLKISGELHNHSGADLAGLQISLAVAGASEPVATHIGELAADERFSLSVLVEGVSQLTGLSLSWQTGVAAPE